MSMTTSRKWRRLALFVAVCCMQGHAAAQDMAIEPRFEMAGAFHRGAAPAFLDGAWGLIDRKGEWLLEPAYPAIRAGSGGYFAFREDDLWGYLDGEGGIAVPPLYEEAGPFVGNAAPVRSDGMWGMIAPDGDVVVGFAFEQMGGHEGEIFAALDDDGWSVFTVAEPDSPMCQGDLSVYGDDFLVEEPPSVEPVSLPTISNGALIAVYPDGKRQFFVGRPADGGEVGCWQTQETPPMAELRPRSEGFSAASNGPGLWGYLDRYGELTWEDRFEDALGFSEGYAPVKVDGKWGYIARSGRFVVEPRYDAAFPFSEGYAVIRAGDKRGFVKNDPERGIVDFIEPQYEDVFRFSEGLAAVKTGGGWGYIAAGQAGGGLFMGAVVDVLP